MHPTGMLDRDQRTAKIPMFLSDMQVPKTNSFRDSTENSNSTSNHCSIISSTKKSTSFLYLNWSKGYLIHRFQRLKNVLLVLVYLTLITLPSSSSAPLKMNSQNPRWVNPCGIAKDTTDSASKLNASEKREFLLQISKQAGIALRHAEAFKENFTKKIFKSENVDKVFEEQRYDWLPNPSDLMFLEDNSKTSEEIQLESYYYLQQVAVGLEQVISDQLDKGGHFPSEFEAQQNLLITVLCEIQMYINDMNIKINRDADRSIMPESLRFVESVTERNVRDYIILRTYENTLDHVKKVFSHLASKV